MYNGIHVRSVHCYVIHIFSGSISHIWWLILDIEGCVCLWQRLMFCTLVCFHKENVCMVLILSYIGCHCKMEEHNDFDYKCINHKLSLYMFFIWKCRYFSHFVHTEMEILDHIIIWSYCMSITSKLKYILFSLLDFINGLMKQHWLLLGFALILTRLHYRFSNNMNVFSVLVKDCHFKYMYILTGTLNIITNKKILPASWTF